ncbi:hypothetical protein G9A89_000102 [Geosiphon pyriformis]|nr:hypothetical protein G9A89_000102 [Geosiphon pyriformis]
MNVELNRTRHEPGDGGVDLFGGFLGYTIVIQCKNHIRKIGPQTLRELEGVLTRFNKNTTIGILVTPSVGSFTGNIINRAKSSEYKEILPSLDHQEISDKEVRDLLTYMTKIIKVLRSWCQKVENSIITAENAGSYENYFNRLKSNYGLLVFSIDDKFIVLTARKLFLQWVLVLSTDEINLIDDINPIDLQTQILSSINEVITFSLKISQDFTDPKIWNFLAANALLEIHHYILKDFRKLLREHVEEDYMNSGFKGHIGYQLCSIQENWRWIEIFFNLLKLKTDFKEYHLLFVSCLTILVDIKKLQEIYDVQASFKDETFLQKLTCQIDPNINMISKILNYKHISIIRKALEVLLLTAKSARDTVFQVLGSISEYTRNLFDSFNESLFDQILSEDITEFFYTKYSFSPTEMISDQVTFLFCDRESLKQLTEIYMTAFIKLIDLPLENIGEDNEVYLNNQYYFQTVNEVIILLKELLSSPNIFTSISRLYGGNDGDMIGLILNLMRFFIGSSKFHEVPEEFTEKSFFVNLSSLVTVLVQNSTPHVIFLRFLQDIAFDHSVLLDFLISNETAFLEFIIIYCKYLENNSKSFINVCGKFDEQYQDQGLDIWEKEGSEPFILRFLSMIIQLRKAIQSLMSRQLFPYNAKSLINRLKLVESIFSMESL